LEAIIKPEGAKVLLSEEEAVHVLLSEKGVLKKFLRYGNWSPLARKPFSSSSDLKLYQNSCLYNIITTSSPSPSPSP
jgi:hypothetical protein